MHVAEDLTFYVSSTEEQYLAIIQAGSVAAPAFRLVPSRVHPYPGVLVNVKQVYVVEDVIRLAPADHTEMRIVYSSSGVASPWGGRGLPGDTRQEPTSRSDVKHEHIIEELMIVSTAEDIEAATCALLAEIDHGVARSGRGNSHGALVVVEHLVPEHL